VLTTKACLSAPLFSGGGWLSRQAKFACLVLPSAGLTDDNGNGDAAFICWREELQAPFADGGWHGDRGNHGKPQFAAFRTGFKLFVEGHKREKTTSRYCRKCK
jgi:hypothetical protein